MHPEVNKTNKCSYWGLCVDEEHTFGGVGGPLKAGMLQVGSHTNLSAAFVCSVLCTAVTAVGACHDTYLLTGDMNLGLLI